MNCLIALSLCLAVDAPTLTKARAVVAVVDARITAAQGPDLPDSKAKTKAGDAGPLKLNLTEQKDAAKSKYKATVYTTTGCIPCKRMKDECGNGNEDLALEWKSPNVAPPNGIPQVFPVTVWTDGSGQLRYHTGYISLKKLVELIERNNPPKSVMAAPMGSGGEFHGRAQIQALLDRAVSYVQPGTTVKTVWKRNRSGKVISLLQKGKKWDDRDVIGDSGRLTVYIDGDQKFQVTKDITIDTLGFAYDLQVDGNNEVLRITPDPLTVNFTRPEKVNAAVGDKVVGMDPITLAWTAISIIRFVVAILNPDVSLHLGPAVEFDTVINKDSMKIVFNNDCPSVHITAWFEFVLQLDNVVVTPDLITVNFKSGSFLSRFVKQRTIRVVD